MKSQLMVRATSSKPGGELKLLFVRTSLELLKGDALSYLELCKDKMTVKVAQFVAKKQKQQAEVSDWEYYRFD